MKQTRLRARELDGPALVERTLVYLRGSTYAKRTVALCFLPYPEVVSGEMIDRYAQDFRDIEVALLMVASAAGPLHRLWMGREGKPRTPVLADAGGRLHRAFRMGVVVPNSRCHTVVFDRTGVLRLRISHDFLEHDLTMLRNIINAMQRDASVEAHVAACAAT